MARLENVTDLPVSGAEETTYYAGRTDVGLVRDHNEDSLLVSPPLFVVADGMGGHAAGEVASEIVVDTLAQLGPSYADGELLARAVKAANIDVIRAPSEGRGRAGMGCTVTAAVLDGQRLVIAQVGDSRAYLLHNGHLQQITRDHSLIADLIEAGQITPEEARVHPDRSVITRAIGTDPYMEPDIYEINVSPHDRILLCSDGLSSMVSDAEITEIMQRNPAPQKCADALIEAALRAGGHDNITVIVIDAPDTSAKRTVKTVKRHYRFMILTVLLAIIAIFAIGAYALNQFVDNSAYIGEDNGYVTIYRGIPGEVMGISFSTVEERSEIPVDSLPAGVAQRIKADLIVDSLDQAHELLQSYRSEIPLNIPDPTSTTDTTKDKKSSATTSKKTTDKKEGSSKKKESSNANKSGATSNAE